MLLKTTGSEIPTSGIAIPNRAVLVEQLYRRSDPCHLRLRNTFCPRQQEQSQRTSRSQPVTSNPGFCDTEFLGFARESQWRSARGKRYLGSGIRHAGKSASSHPCFKQVQGLPFMVCGWEEGGLCSVSPVELCSAQSI